MSSTELKNKEVEIAALKPTLTYRVLEFVFLLLTTVVLGATFLFSIFSSLPGLGFRNNTGAVSNFYDTQFTPAGWTFIIWGIIYTAQTIWIIYAWSYVFRPSTPRGISFVTYIFYTIANLGNITWLYLWGNYLPQAALGVIIVIAFFLYATAIAQAIHLYRQTPALSTTKKFKIDLYLTHVLVLNGVVLYACWVSAATQLNFVIVLQYISGIDATTAGTVGLSILLVEIVVYFILENTILDRFARYIFVVYPLFIWAFSGVLSQNWTKQTERRNPNFALALLILCIVLFIIRIILWIVFALKRPLPKPKTVV